MRRLPGPALLSVTPRRGRRRYGGAVWSVLAHLVLIGLLFWTINRDFASIVERGSPLTRRGGGGGGGGGEYVALPALPAPAPRPVTPPAVKPVTPPVQSVPVIVPETIPPPADTTPSAPTPAAATGAPNAAAGGPGTGPGTGGGTGGGAGTGTGPGTGAGTGPGNGGGGGRRPRQRRIEIPWGDTPKELRGDSVSVLFLLGPDGKPLRITVIPEIREKGFARKFLDAMQNAEFYPARGPDGLPVSDTFTVLYKF